MRHILLPALLILLISCKTTPPNSQVVVQEMEEPLFKVNNTPVYQDEFLYAYNKSLKNKGENEPVDDYLNLYINFKLKVEDAKKEGIDTLPSYKNELAGYLKDVRKPYLVTEKVNKALLTETYNRLQQEVKASHILIKVDKEATPADTVQAYNKITEIRSKYEAGEAFNDLAAQYSEDPSAKQNQGELGWFTAFMMVYPFESAAFETETGGISKIVRTRFGYHLIKVYDRRETSGRIKISHLMRRFPPNGSWKDSADVKKRTYEIHGKLMEGEEWFAAVTNYSQDLNTKDNGGSLPWFGIGNLPPSLEKAAFKLIEPDQISSPIQSPYGWHILKLEDKRGMGTMESMEESLTRRIQRDERSALRVSEIIEKLKQENNFQKNEGVYLQLRNETQITDSLPQALKMQTLFSINGKVYPVQNFIDNGNLKTKFDKAVAAYEQEAILQYEDEHLGDKYPEYRLLAAEYRDGLLLFEIMSRKVWNRIGRDTLGMEKYYKQNKEAYKSKPGIRADIFYMTDTANIEKLKPVLNDSLYLLMDDIAITNDAPLKLDLLQNYTTPVYARLALLQDTDDAQLEKLNQKIQKLGKHIVLLEPSYSGKKEVHLQLFSPAADILGEVNVQVTKVESGVFETGEVFTDPVSTKSGESIIIKDENEFRLINVYESYEAKPLSYNEAKGELINDYQTHLENKWIEQLKAENTVVVNQDILSQVKKKIEK